MAYAGLVRRWRGSRSHTGSHVPVSRYRRSRRTRRRAPPPRSRTRSGTSTVGPGRAARAGCPGTSDFAVLTTCGSQKLPTAALRDSAASPDVAPFRIRSIRQEGLAGSALGIASGFRPAPAGSLYLRGAAYICPPWGSRRMGRRPTGRCARFRAAGRFRLVRGGGRISRRSCPRNGSRPAPPYS